MHPPENENQKSERNRKGFRLEHLRQAQALSWKTLHAIQASIRPGMTEAEARKLGEAVLKEMGATKNWHRVIFRFGENTLKKFSEPSIPNTVLGENDIYFVDLGPVWEIDGVSYEGDVGDTFCTGSSEEHRRCAEACRKIFKSVSEIWQQEALSGQELYRRATLEAEKTGYVLNQDVDGHRVGDFPHQIFFKGGLNDLDFKPREGIWILEIQIRHPSLPFGAFVEDTLG